jgi:UDP-N-acetylglucosamine acyltransferase
MDHAATMLDDAASLLDDNVLNTKPLDAPLANDQGIGTIHPTAIVAPGAVVAPDAVVGPWCSVGPDVVLESGVRLISHVVADGHTVIGAGTVVYPFCTVGMAPQDLKYKGEPTRTIIGPRTQIREHCTIHRGTVTGSGVTSVGADCLLMAVVHVAHDCALGDGVIVANNVVMGGHVTIGDNAVIGGASALHQFVRIGRGAMVGGVSGVESDVVPFATVMGNRAYLSGLNLVGLKRRGVDRAGLHRLRAAFRALFAAGGGEVFAERVARTRASAEDPYVIEMLDFIEAPSRRGLIRHIARRLQDDEIE